MTEKTEMDVPRDGDLVRVRGRADGPVMVVESEALGEQHLHEGVANGILCTWTEDGQDCFEVYRQGQLVVVQRAAAPASTER